MHLMLQQPKADDYVIGTGEAHKVREFAELAFRHVGLPWEDYVRSDKQFRRPAEVEHLRADATKAREKLGWRPAVSFEELVQMMVESDLKAEANER
jgi:GDPmannose 4,6-dehydratase